MCPRRLSPSVLYDVSSVSNSQNTTGIQRAVFEISRELSLIFKSRNVAPTLRLVAFKHVLPLGEEQSQELKEGVGKNRSPRIALTNPAVRFRRLLARSSMLTRLWLVFLPLSRLPGLLLRILKGDVSNLVVPKSGDCLVLADAFWDPRARSISFAKSLKKRGGLIVVMIYDIFPITQPTWFPKSITKPFSRQLSWVVQNSDLIIVNSKKVRGDIVANFPGINENKFRVVQLGCFFNKNLEVNPVNRLPKSILMIGTIEPRKNYELVLEWWDTFGKHGQWSLTIVGGGGWKADDVIRNLIRRQGGGFSWLNDVDDEALLRMMATHEVGLSTSHDEGFGLPAVEMFKSGLKLVLSDIEVYRELHDEAQFFDHTSVASLDSALRRAAASQFRDSRRGATTWHDTAQGVLGNVENLMKARLRKTKS